MASHDPWLSGNPNRPTQPPYNPRVIPPRESGEDNAENTEYDINDPRTQQHNAYKISQVNGIAATRRFWYGDDVDSKQNVDYTGYNPNPIEANNQDSAQLKLQNAQEARSNAVDEANRRYAWNGQFAGGAHDGVEQQADQRMNQVDKWNARINDLQNQINQAHAAHEAGIDMPEDEEEGEEEHEPEEMGDEDGQYNVNSRQGAQIRRQDQDTKFNMNNHEGEPADEEDEEDEAGYERRYGRRYEDEEQYYSNEDLDHPEYEML